MFRAAIVYVLLSAALWVSTSVPSSACGNESNCTSDINALLDAELGSARLLNGNSKDGNVSVSVDGDVLVGSISRDDDKRKTDVDLESVDIQVKYDGFGGQKALTLKTVKNQRIHQSGSVIEWVADWNYPEWVSRAEIRIYRASRKFRYGPGVRPALNVPVNRQSIVGVPGNTLEDGDYLYTLRVYDDAGRYDETEPFDLVIGNELEGSSLPHASVENGGRGLREEPAIDPATGTFENKLAISNIPITGGAVTVYGKNIPSGYQVKVVDRPVDVSAENEFVHREVLAGGDHDINILVYDPQSGRSVEFERPVYIPSNDWFYVGIADVTVGKRIGRDSEYLAPVAPGEYERIYKKGRLAFYLKGKIRGQYILTAAMDTNEEDLGDIFTNLNSKDARQLLRRLDPDDYYPVYGDDSVTREDAPTAGRFYVRLERGNSHVMWGNFKTRIDGIELAKYERALYGAHANLETQAVTSRGKPVASLKAFAAQPGSLPQREEFRGTGGSVYFMQRQDINQGSEQIAIEVRDATTGLTIESRLLNEGEDYTMDYVQGVLILSSPLSSTGISSGPVLTSGVGSDHQYVVATYEYTPTLGDTDGLSYGGRAQAWLLDQIRVGVSGYQENTGIADQTLIGADITWQFTDHSYFQFEWAQSEGDSFGAVTSTDGGFIFNPVSGENASGIAVAWRARVHLDLGELSNGALKGKIGAGYEQREAGFNAPGRYTRDGERIMDAHIEIHPTENIKVTAKYDEVDREGGVSKRDTTAQIAVRLNDRVSVEAGVLNSDYNGENSFDGTGNRTDIGARINFHGSGTNKIYVFGQTTVDKDSSRDRNDRIGIGFETDLTDRLALTGEISEGTSGIGIQTGLTYQPTPEEKYHVGFRMLPGTNTNKDLNAYDPFGRDNGTLVAGVRKKLTDRTTAWSEHTFDMMGTEQGHLQAYGVEFQPDNAWRISAGVEAGVVEDEISGEFERLAPSVNVTYKDEGLNLSSRLEARFENSEDGTRDRTTWLTKTALSVRHNDNWRFLAHLDAAISDSDESSIQNANYIEGSIGYAYRPVDNDRLNALFKYTYLHDLPAPQQANADNRILGPKQRSHIVSADFVYDLTERLSVGAKYGYRTGEISVSRDEADFVRSTAQLGIIRADYHIVKNWDIFAEARVLKLNELEQTNYGALLGVYRHIGDNLKFGIGYNFGQFSDDLSDLTLNDGGIFFNLVGKI